MGKWRMQLHNDKGPKCRECNDRHLGCHVECEDYKRWLAEHRAKHEEMLKVKREEDFIAGSYRRRIVCRAMDKRKRR